MPPQFGSKANWEAKQYSIRVWNHPHILGLGKRYADIKTTVSTTYLLLSYHEGTNPEELLSLHNSMVPWFQGSDWLHIGILWLFLMQETMQREEGKVQNQIPAVHIYLFCLSTLCSKGAMHKISLTFHFLAKQSFFL